MPKIYSGISSLEDAVKQLNSFGYTFLNAGRAPSVYTVDAQWPQVARSHEFKNVLNYFLETLQCVDLGDISLTKKQIEREFGCSVSNKTELERRLTAYDVLRTEFAFNGIDYRYIYANPAKPGQTRAGFGLLLDWARYFHNYVWLYPHDKFFLDSLQLGIRTLTELSSKLEAFNYNIEPRVGRSAILYMPKKYQDMRLTSLPQQLILLRTFASKTLALTTIFR